MVMGLNNSAQTWQRLLTKVLSEMLFKSAIVYLDDILILSHNFNDHINHLIMLFNKFRHAKLRMNGKKCKFAVKQVKYLGHILSGSGIAVDPAKTEVITKWPTPNTSRRVKSFLGVANYWKFIPAYSQRSAALRQLISKNKRFFWGTGTGKVISRLKVCVD